MHEYHMVEAIVKDVVEAARRNNALRVTKVNLVMKELSELDAGSIKMYFEEMAKGGPAQGAELVITEAKAELKCPACNFIFERNGKELHCPRCGGACLPARSGGSLYIADIEVEK